MAGSSVLFSAPDLAVRRGPAFESPVCFVTFSSFTHERDLDRPGFGEAFLASRGFNAVHVISRTNAWFDYPETAEALAVAAGAAARYARIVTYGSSMGGYAAIRFADSLGAQLAIAISPQYGVGGPAAAFETRFRSERRRYAKADLSPWHGSAAVKPYVLFDPLDLDALHVRRIARFYPRLEAVPLPNAGHPAGPYLEETGLLTGAVVDIAEDRFDAAAFSAAARRGRRRSSQYHFTLARRLGPSHRAMKIALMRTAIGLRDDATYRTYLATLLELSDQIAAAEGQLRLARALLPAHPVILYAQASFLMRRRRWAEAREIVTGLVERHPENHWFTELATVLAAVTHPSTRQAFAPRLPRQVAEGALARAGWTAWLAVIALLTRLHAAPGWRRLPLPRWHERYFNLPREVRLLDEWARRRGRRGGLTGF